ncbi:hypothetical protein ANN_12911 [Periplaneta americana]|uniref:RNase H type-1 domain-containing protein n=1 Tax=Periplaneta americana TaxID=6978 RepID=A0ABQ8TIF8_PERAM|nr:hypothetical protein ANN_12911 [Periplaneta americana]
MAGLCEGGRLAFEVHNTATASRKNGQGDSSIVAEFEATEVHPSFLDIFNYTFCYIGIMTAKAYRTVSNDALCVITGIIPINIQIEETAEYYRVVKRSRNQHDHENRNQIDHDMELKHWQHPADHVKVREGKEDNEYNIIKIFTDGSKGELGVGAGVAIFKEGNLEEALKYRLNGKCSNNQAEQLAILKAIQHVQTLESQQQKFQYLQTAG